ncbi:MAG: hypothetical protein Q4F31_05910 [Eubacteriales bacterium]|nr:hypothetical protein [Eubacteriales bacterium]
MKILSVVIPVVLTVILGMICREAHILTSSDINAAKKIAVNITLPAVSFSAYLNADYSPRNLVIPLWVLICCCTMLAMGFGLKKLFRSSNRLLPFLCSGFEGGMLGFSLYPILHPDMGPFSLLIMGNVFFVFTVYKILLSGAKGKRAILLEAVKSPSLWALFFGIIFSASGLYKAMAPSGVQAVFDDTLTFVSRSTSFLILLTIGFDLDFRKIQWRTALTAFLGREVICGIMLVLTLLLNRYVLHGMISTDAALVMFILSPPYVIKVFAGESEDADILSSSLSIMTLFTLLMFIIISTFV